MGGPVANSGVEDTQYIYISVVDGVPVGAAVLAPKCGPLGVPPKNVK